MPLARLRRCLAILQKEIDTREYHHIFDMQNKTPLTSGGLMTQVLILVALLLGIFLYVYFKGGRFH